MMRVLAYVLIGFVFLAVTGMVAWLDVATVEQGWPERLAGPAVFITVLYLMGCASVAAFLLMAAKESGR